MQTNKIILILSLVLLLCFYIFQKNILGLLEFQELSKNSIFVLKKIVRFLINDFLMIGVIYGIFKTKDAIKVALIVQLFGFVFLLTPYILIKLYIGGYNGPLVSFLHRLVLNPLLLILLIPALYFQRNYIDNKISE